MIQKPFHNTVASPAIVPDIVKRHMVEREMARRSFSSFLKYRYKMEERFIAWNWHHDYLCEIMQAVAARELKRVIVNVPPGCLKSETLSQAWQAWMIGRDPTIRSSMFSGAGTGLLAKRDVRATLDIIRAPWFRQVFPDIPRLTKETENEFRLEGGAFRQGVGVGAQTTGFGGHHLLWDDLLDRMKANSATERAKVNEWMTMAFTATRLRDRVNGTITGIMQRLHEDDPTGHIERLMEASKGDINYTIIVVPQEMTSPNAITYSIPGTSSSFEYVRQPGELMHPAWIDEKAIAEIKASLINEGFDDFEGQHNQKPVREKGSFFNRGELNNSLYDPEAPESRGGLPSRLNYYMSTDLAVTKKDSADETCIWPFGVDATGDIWLLPEVTHGRFGVTEIHDELIRYLTKTYGPNESEMMMWVIESGVIEKSVLPVLDETLNRLADDGEISWIPEAWTPVPVADKRARAFPIRTYIKQGKIHFPDTDWTKNVAFKELMKFTGIDGGVDNIVDTLAWIGHMVQQHITVEPLPMPEERIIEGSYEDLYGRHGESYDIHKPKKLISSR